MSHTPKLAAGEGRWGGLGGHEYDPGQTKRAGVHYSALSQQQEQRAGFWGVFGSIFAVALRTTLLPML